MADSLAAAANVASVVHGAGVYLLQACMNHSCVPNVEVVQGTPTAAIVLKLTQPVRAGESLTVSYIPIENGGQDWGLAAVRRRHKALRSYFFTCGCARCVVERAAGTEDSAEGEGGEGGDS